MEYIYRKNFLTKDFLAADTKISEPAQPGEEATVIIPTLSDIKDKLDNGEIETPELLY